MSTERKLDILKNVLGDFYSSNSEYLFHCPRCDHHKRKLSINLEKDVYKCWVCDWSGRSIYRIIRRFGSYSEREDWKGFSTRIEVENFSQKLFGTPEAEREQTLSLPKEFISLANKDLPPTAAYPLNYLRSRGLTKSDIIRWKIGYCSEGQYASRIIVPSFGMTGKPNYFVGRSYSGDWKKYMNPQADKDVIFNHLYLDFDEDVVLVEGIFDAIVAGQNSIPLLGSTLREESRLFQEIVKNDTPVYIALDADARKKEMQLINKFLKYDIEIYKIDIDEHTDVGDMNKQAFLRRKQTATFIDSTNYLIKKIQRI